MKTQVVVAFVGILCFTNSNAFAESQPKLEVLLELWTNKSDGIDSLRATYEGEVFTPRGMFIEAIQGPDGITKLEFPPEDHRFEKRGELILDLKGERSFWRFEAERYNIADPNDLVLTLFPVDEVNLFDGTVYKRFVPRKGNVSAARPEVYSSIELYTYDTHRRLTQLQYEEYGLLIGIGLLPVTGAYDIGHLRKPIDPQLLRITSDTIIDGVSCFILTQSAGAASQEYTVESHSPYRIREFRQFMKADGTLMASLSIKYSDQTNLPSTWEVTKRSFMTGALATYEMRLVDYEINPVVSAKDFELDPPSGTLTYDERRPSGDRKFVVGDETVPEIPVNEHELQTAAKRSRNWTFLMIASGVAVAVGGVLIYRRMAA